MRRAQNSSAPSTPNSSGSSIRPMRTRVRGLDSAAARAMSPMSWLNSRGDAPGYTVPTSRSAPERRTNPA